LHALDVPAPKIWQGRSLLANSDNKATYFFAPYSTFVFGYREDNYKYIYDAGYNITEIYNLNNDPHETTNLIGASPISEEEIQKRLAVWVQYHDEYMKDFVFK